ncbi:MAG: hypothetical protein E7608_03275 [Ruminococcaceae bacterium]|nr:hypothetical protein [Oscillospiraceae bacterium]
MDDKNFDLDSVKFSLNRSWEIHRQTFGPILEPAFAENKEVRIILINALNHISRRNVKRGMELLNDIRQYCVYDEDKAAWMFFVGLCFEMCGKNDEMLKWYEKAGEFGHRFYLPYLKLAKAAHGSAQFEKAKAYYETAIECLLEGSEADREYDILGSAYTNLAACLTMLRKYSEAENAWLAAQKYPLQKGSYSTAAVLYAAMGNSEKAAKYISLLKESSPETVRQTEELTQQILCGTHPFFSL